MTEKKPVTFESLLLKNKITTSEIAQYLNVSNSHVSKWVLGKCKPNSKYRHLLAKLIGEDIYRV